MKMSIRIPSRLLELVGQSLLRDHLTISTLEELPMELFPPLFMEAFSRRRCEALKLMVQAWFRRLPLRPLVKMACLETFQAVLDGLDALLTHGVHLRRWIQVLDLQDVTENFWMVWSEAMAHGCSPNSMRNRKPVPDCPWMRGQQPLTLFIDLWLKNRTLDEYLICLLLWVKPRKDLLHCCKTLKILGMPFHNIRNILKMVNLDCIQEVEVNCNWILPMLTQFTYLGQMKNQKLYLSHMDVSHYVSPKEKEFFTQFTIQFLNLHCHQLYMNSVSFLEGHLDQLPSCLKTPLKILAITNCVLESDLRHLSQCPSISQLKTHLSGIRLANFSLVPLQVLLEKVAATLEYLDLGDCGIVDSQGNAIVPALSRCFELTTFSFCGNPISMATLESLLCHTTRLNNLCLELYPAPRESYGLDGTVCRSRFSQFRTELLRVRDLRHPKRILFCTDYCPDCGNRSFYSLEAVQCCC
ncbi:LOW QUALITY PROTEIN: PRAMEF27 isoform 1 [Pongo abelii]|uniref:PRAMEF27 isoform 1 n=1 Tax=Pongo abelii TaxID=9601 RepID=A0A2J8QYV1_PONAB|nr:LOW QUALITY PROTEIN: PRAMEF27 isoform 1 [Pongo abelii]